MYICIYVYTNILDIGRTVRNTNRTWGVGIGLTFNLIDFWGVQFGSV